MFTLQALSLGRPILKLATIYSYVGMYLPAVDDVYEETVAQMGAEMSREGSVRGERGLPSRYKPTLTK